jgi:hypothetical protein
MAAAAGAAGDRATISRTIAANGILGLNVTVITSVLLSSVIDDRVEADEHSAQRRSLARGAPYVGPRRVPSGLTQGAQRASTA